MCLYKQKVHSCGHIGAPSLISKPCDEPGGHNCSRTVDTSDVQQLSTECPACAAAKIVYKQPESEESDTVRRWEREADVRKPLAAEEPGKHREK